MSMDRPSLHISSTSSQEQAIVSHTLQKGNYPEEKIKCVQTMSTEIKDAKTNSSFGRKSS